MKLYRYDIELRQDVFNIAFYGEPICRKYEVIKETPKGYWINICGKRWVSKESKKRFAYPTKKEALISCLARTKRRIQYLDRDMKLAMSGKAKLIELLQK